MRQLMIFQYCFTAVPYSKVIEILYAKESQSKHYGYKPFYNLRINVFTTLESYVPTTLYIPGYSVVFYRPKSTQ